MKPKAEKYFNQLLFNHASLETCHDDIHDAFLQLVNCYRSGGKVLVCGNGGSAADADHIVGELMKSFTLARDIPETDREKIRRGKFDNAEYLISSLQCAVPAISLSSHAAVLTACANDVDAEIVFAQQVYGYGKSGDVLIALSTSGNSRNVCNAVKVARAMGLVVIGLTGENGGMIKPLCSVAICAPARETYRVQEYHLPIYHALCLMLEEELFGND
jgi:D-sedoheptulose 7-phosphate isomerase